MMSTITALGGPPRSGSGLPIQKIATHAGIGAAIGAAGAVALSFTALPIVGGAAAPIAAAIGGAAGLVVGGLIGFLRGRSSASQASTGVLQLAPPAPRVSAGGLPPQLPRAV